MSSKLPILVTASILALAGCAPIISHQQYLVEKVTTVTAQGNFVAAYNYLQDLRNKGPEGRQQAAVLISERRSELEQGGIQQIRSRVESETASFAELPKARKQPDIDGILAAELAPFADTFGENARARAEQELAADVRRAKLEIKHAVWARRDKSTLYAWKPRPATFEFRGRQLGEPLTEQFIQAHCASRPMVTPDVTCFEWNGAIGRVKTTFAYRFLDEKLAQISLGFSAGEYEYLKAALTAKYGHPARVRQSRMENRMGAQFLNEVAEWTKAEGTISLSRYGTTFESGNLEITATDAEPVLERVERKKIEQAVEDL